MMAASCVNHPDRPGTLGCAHCGAAVCVDCCVQLQVGSRCLKCAGVAPAEPAGGEGHPVDRLLAASADDDLPESMLFTLGAIMALVGSVFGMPLVPLIGGAALWWAAQRAGVRARAFGGALLAQATFWLVALPGVLMLSGSVTQGPGGRPRVDLEAIGVVESALMCALAVAVAAALAWTCRSAVRELRASGHALVAGLTLGLALAGGLSALAGAAGLVLA